MIEAQGSLTVAWLTNVSQKWIQAKTVNAVALNKPCTDKAEQVDYHLEVKRADNKWLAHD